MNDNEKTLPNAAGPIILFSLLFGNGHAIERFQAAGAVLWKDVPVFILKMGLSLAAFILLGRE